MRGVGRESLGKQWSVICLSVCRVRLNTLFVSISQPQTTERGGLSWRG